ncbi:cupin domain-containing protein [Subsaxibacter sp. CAU 1640]|uniref:cupin domain-containing protein n=1 Tax=Subsaxibacter sp. CAU 1640 TaxID=2933271 RepID=UPI002003F2E7|nr:cupin domain-containing protein [Subsaxibacter sp. CAU 1640]MCK7591516.1 cupin domain-containing protein [Subsaxibacter sp. CAU 1640]
MKTTTTKWVLGHKVTPFDTTGDYDLMMAETPPNVPGPPPHLHHSYKEVFLIVEGEMEFMVNGETKIYKAGESVEVLPNTLHTFSNISNQPCKWVNIHSPKGFRDFFETTGIPVDESDAQQRSVAPEMIQKVIQTAANYDMHIKI